MYLAPAILACAVMAQAPAVPRNEPPAAPAGKSFAPPSAPGIGGKDRPKDDPLARPGRPAERCNCRR